MEPLSGYLNLAMSLDNNKSLHGEPFNFGPSSLQNHSVKNLVTEMSHHWDQVRWQDISEQKQGPYESGLLKLNCDKALHQLGWLANWDFERTVKDTVDWYKTCYKSPNRIAEKTHTGVLSISQMPKRRVSLGSMTLLEQIQITPLRESTSGGDVLHALKSTEDDFHGFDEAYFSFVDHDSIKAWKQHLRMTMNLVVPVGSVSCFP